MNTENNKLIAEFMGVANEYEFKNSLSRDFHTSWDWLMPVVAQCTKVGYGDFENPLTKKWEELFEPLESAFLGNHINEVYEAVVEFIKWYNENKEEQK